MKESLGKVDAKLQEIEKARDRGLQRADRAGPVALGNPEGPSHARRRNLVKPCGARRPAAAGAKSNCGGWWRWPACWPIAISSSSKSTDSDDGRLRPDLIVQLPGGKNIVVDSKAPLEAYLEAIEATDDETRTREFKDHARQVRNAHRRLGPQVVFRAVRSSRPSSLCCSLPGEVFFSAALEQRSRADRVGRRART